MMANKVLEWHFGDTKHTFKRNIRLDGKEYRTGIRGQESGIGGQQPGGSYDFREAQILNSSDFTSENSELRAGNTYFWMHNP